MHLFRQAYFSVILQIATTAATTEISYGDESYITLKSQSQLLDEINAVVEYQDMSFATIENLLIGICKS